MMREYGVANLVMGSQGPSVQQLQDLLSACGFVSTDPPGVYDYATRGAVLMFQRSIGLNPTGRADPNTIAALKEASGPPVCQGPTCVADQSSNLPGGPLLRPQPVRGAEHMSSPFDRRGKWG